MSNKTVNPFKVKIHLLECELEEKDLKISELEAKLAESEKHRKEAYKEGLLQKQFDKDAEIMQLKQQLAEKEKEIEKISFQYNTVKEARKLEASFRREDIKQQAVIVGDLEKKVDKANQDKISFCIEKLEKVKEVCSQVWAMEYAVDAIEDYIDNQIKQLKEGK